MVFFHQACFSVKCKGIVNSTQMAVYTMARLQPTERSNWRQDFQVTARDSSDVYFTDHKSQASMCTWHIQPRTSRSTAV
jgi:hypothetical protein